MPHNEIEFIETPIFREIFPNYETFKTVMTPSIITQFFNDPKNEILFNYLFNYFNAWNFSWKELASIKPRIEKIWHDMFIKYLKLDDIFQLAIKELKQLREEEFIYVSNNDRNLTEEQLLANQLKGKNDLFKDKKDNDNMSLYNMINEMEGVLDLTNNMFKKLFTSDSPRLENVLTEEFIESPVLLTIEILKNITFDLKSVLVKGRKYSIQFRTIFVGQVLIKTDVSEMESFLEILRDGTINDLTTGDSVLAANLADVTGQGAITFDLTYSLLNNNIQGLCLIGAGGSLTNRPTRFEFVHRNTLFNITPTEDIILIVKEV